MNKAEKITPEMFLPEMVERYPATRAVLDHYGLHGCGGPLGPSEPVGWFARLHGVPIDQLSLELNDAADGSSTRMQRLYVAYGTYRKSDP